ncbi:shieldin complex subunit 1 isoform X3 [Mustela putorius furo]|uniref:Shieldin complex subunit 1 isoform X3 n=1 Tax=Mustela putorius furo TaxID=9669 RepID=A0A8U0V6S3_MUSPF|nr:shieldin complex subunit 1 isoform X3 [Mustela putorius furo]
MASVATSLGKSPKFCRTMATQDTAPGSQSEESNALDLASINDIKDYALQRPHQEADSDALSSVETLSLPCSSDVDSELALGTSPESVLTVRWVMFTMVCPISSDARMGQQLSVKTMSGTTRAYLDFPCDTCLSLHVDTREHLHFTLKILGCK